MLVCAVKFERGVNAAEVERLFSGLSSGPSLDIHLDEIFVGWEHIHDGIG